MSECNSCLNCAILVKFVYVCVSTDQSLLIVLCLNCYMALKIFQFGVRFHRHAISVFSDFCQSSDDLTWPVDCVLVNKQVH